MFICKKCLNWKKVYTTFLDGNHIVRRSDRFWGGLSTDLIIKQVLMRSVKSVGGMSEAQRAQWLLSMPACAEINTVNNTKIVPKQG